MPDRRQFLNLAALFEGGLIALAFFLGWLVEVDPLQSFAWEWKAAAWGAAAAVPLFWLFLFSQQFPVGPLQPIKRFLVETLGPPLSSCRWYDLVGLAVLVGFSEELLFRGLVQPWFEGWWGWRTALVATNMIFGLAHSITPLYAVVAGLTGVYLSLLLDVPAERNLLAPVVTHGLYDYLAFLLVVRAYRTESSDGAQSGFDRKVDGSN